MPDVNTLACVLPLPCCTSWERMLVTLQLQILRQSAKLVADLEPEVPLPQHFP